MKFVGKSLLNSLGVGFTAGYDSDRGGFAFQFRRYLLVGHSVLKHKRSEFMHDVTL